MSPTAHEERSTAHFLDVAKGKPVFFLDTLRDEALVLPRQLLEAGDEDAEVISWIAQYGRGDVIDAKSVKADRAERYRRMPDVAVETQKSWIDDFAKNASPIARQKAAIGHAAAACTFDVFEAKLKRDLPTYQSWLEFKAERYCEQFILWVNTLNTGNALPPVVAMAQ